jgi:outer membrane receptor protein involved in Fe transport
MRLQLPHQANRSFEDRHGMAFSRHVARCFAGLTLDGDCCRPTVYFAITQTPETMKRHTQASAIGMLFFGSILAASLSAQTVATPTANTQTPPPAAAQVTPTTVASGTEEEQVVKLSPFEVSTTRNIGYQATDTLAGTRIRTDLKDVGASISVLTKEFLNDIGATDSASMLEYTPNAQTTGVLGTYAGVGNSQSVDESGNLRAPASAQRLRGLAAADNARDYYITDIPWDSFNVDRVDILRGPNSILYGLGSPAGIVNASTRGATFQNRGEVTARTGSWGSNRASVDLNQQLIDNVLAIRVDGLWDDAKYEQKPAFQNDKRIYGALRFDPQLFKNRDFHTSIKAKIEHGEINANRPRTLPPNDNMTAWYNPVALSASNPFGGMGKALINNTYDLWRTDNVVAGGSRGTGQRNTVNYQPYLTDIPNQQQPFWLIDGATNQTLRVDGGYINAGARNSSGGFTSASDGILGKRRNAMLLGVTDLVSAVTNYNAWNSAYFPDAKYGQYRRQSLLDPSVFDFYNILIDGPTKKEWEGWNAYNLDFTQTGWDDRVGLELTYDRQKYHNGQQALLGGNPAITLDITQTFSDGSTNPNVGRPFVQGANNNGGRSFYTDREYKRASLFGELRASDFFKNDFLVMLLGRQRFNAIAADEKYFNENRTWQMYANSQAWAGYWNGNDGSGSSFADRAPMAFIYLGSSVANRSSASGAKIPGVATNITLQDSGVYVYDPSWKNPTGFNFSDPWSVPTSMNTVYDGLPNPESTTQRYQVSNPANLVGWNSNFQDNLLRYNDGSDLSLLTLAQKSLRETISYAGSYQGYFWNNALVATLGWRYDEVKTKDKTAAQQSLQRSVLNLQPNVYSIEGGYPHNQIVKGHSTSGGAVLHLNQILKHDPLPFNISVSYNESSNFQVTSVRRDLYGNPIQNPSGKTYEYGVLLSTKDGKVSFRAVKYKTRLMNGSSTLTNSGTIGSVVQQGLRWRNVFLYQLGAYDWGTRNTNSYRNTWTNMYTTETPAQAQAEEDAAITAWNNIQKTLDAKGFFKAWNFTPTTLSVLTDRTTYLGNPSAYAPDPATVYAYSAVTPQGFAVTADIQSKGEEYELTANPLPNWRIAINASKATAVQTNVGGATTGDFVNYMTAQLINADGTLTPAGKMAQFGSQPIYTYIWGPWLSGYTLLKLQEGSAVPELSKWRFNFVTNYDFTNRFLNGHLKGVGVGGAYRWIDKVAIGYPVTASGTVATFDFNHPYYGPTEHYIDLWVSYARKLSSKINWQIQLNVRNVGAKDGLLPVSIEPDGKTWASVRVKPVQQWFVTNTFNF